MQEEEHHKVELGKYRNYPKISPWSLIKYVIITAVVIFLAIYILTMLEDNEDVNSEQNGDKKQEILPVEIYEE